MLRVCYPFVGDSIGGSHLSATELITNLPSAEVEPLVVLHRHGVLETFLSERGIDIQRCPDARLAEAGPIVLEFAAMLRAAVPLAGYLRRRRIGIVHSNDFRMHLTWGLAAKLAGARFVWHQRSAEDSRRLGLYSRLADAVLTISEHCRSSFAPAMARRARVIENPFATDAAAPDRAKARTALLAELGAPGDAVVVGFVGNLTDQKRPLVFVEAAARLRDRLGGRGRFPLFGEPRAGLRERVESRIETLRLNGHCVLMGPRFPIEPWLAACDVLLAPAVNEGSGRAPVEAMLVGTPVVAADHGGHREIIDHGRTGLLVAPDDADAFAEAVTALLADPARTANMVAAARAAAAERFSTARHVATVLSVYRNLAR